MNSCHVTLRMFNDGRKTVLKVLMIVFVNLNPRKLQLMVASSWPILQKSGTMKRR